MAQTLLTLSEMAERLSVSSKTLKKYVRDLNIPHLALGKSLRFDPATVDAYLLAQMPERSSTVVKFQLPVRKSSAKKSRFAEAAGI